MSRKAIKGERRPVRKNNVVIIQNRTKSIKRRMMSRHEDGGYLGLWLTDKLVRRGERVIMKCRQETGLIMNWQPVT